MEDLDAVVDRDFLRKVDAIFVGFAAKFERYGVVNALVMGDLTDRRYDEITIRLSMRLDVPQDEQDIERCGPGHLHRLDRLRQQCQREFKAHRRAQLRSSSRLASVASSSSSPPPRGHLAQMGRGVAAAAQQPSAVDPEEAQGDPESDEQPSAEALRDAMLEAQEKAESLLTQAEEKAKQVQKFFGHADLDEVLESVSHAKFALTNIPQQSSHAAEALFSMNHAVAKVALWHVDDIINMPHSRLWLLNSSFALWRGATQKLAQMLDRSAEGVCTQYLRMQVLVEMAEKSERDCRDVLTWRAQCEVGTRSLRRRDDFLKRIHEAVEEAGIKLAQAESQAESRGVGLGFLQEPRFLQARVNAKTYLREAARNDKHGQKFISQQLMSHRLTVAKTFRGTFLSNCQRTAARRGRTRYQRPERTAGVMPEAVDEVNEDDEDYNWPWESEWAGSEWWTGEDVRGWPETSEDELNWWAPPASWGFNYMQVLPVDYRSSPSTTSVAIRPPVFRGSIRPPPGLA